MYINLADTFNLTSKLTFKRLTNAIKVYQSYNSSRKAGIAKMGGMPISLSIEPTTACNLRCPECPSGLRSFTRPTGRLDDKLFTSLINEVQETLLYLIFYFQGEPYLHPQLLQMIKYAHGRRIYTATSTNAHFLDDKNAWATVQSGLDRMIISIDGATQATYEAYRKEGKLEKVLEGTQNLIKWKKKLRSPTPHVVWQFLVVKPNEHEISAIKKLGHEYGVDHIAFKSAQIYDYEDGNELIPTKEKFSRYKLQSDGTYAPKHALENECWKMWHSCVVTWDGKVVPCCFDKDAHYVLGNFGEKKFSEIWHSDAYNQFRNQLLTSRSEIEMCKNCTEGAKVWV